MISRYSNSNSTFIALNLHLLTDSKALDPTYIQSHCPLTICLIAVGGNRSARRKPTTNSLTLYIYQLWYICGTHIYISP